MDNKKRVGFALCGSFCTFSAVLPVVGEMSKIYDVLPLMSPAAASTDTRFGTAESFVRKLQEITGKKPICTIAEAEPIGPKKLLDALVVAPCTGNTLAKLANSIADTSVTLAVKAHLRNERPVIVAVSTNDGLCGAAANIGKLLSLRNYYFVPFGQDDAFGKPRSLVAKMEYILPTVEAALEGKQIQPILR